MFIESMCSDVYIIQEFVKHCSGSTASSGAYCTPRETVIRDINTKLLLTCLAWLCARRHQLLLDFCALPSDSFHNSGVELCSKSLFMCPGWQVSQLLIRCSQKKTISNHFFNMYTHRRQLIRAESKRCVPSFILGYSRSRNVYKKWFKCKCLMGNSWFKNIIFHFMVCLNAHKCVCFYEDYVKENSFLEISKAF